MHCLFGSIVNAVACIILEMFLTENYDVRSDSLTLVQSFVASIDNLSPHDLSGS